MNIFKKIKASVEKTASLSKASYDALPIEQKFNFHIHNKKPSEYLNFLKQDFTTEEKKKLQKELKRLYREGNTSHKVEEVNGIVQWKQGWVGFHVDAQEWLYVAALRFYNRRDMRSMWRNYLEGDLAKGLLKTHAPGWFAGYIDDELGGEWPRISFQVLYQYYENEVIPKPNPEGYISALSNLQTDYKWENENKDKSFIYQYLNQHPAIIKEDIHLFFEYPHNAHNYDNYKSEVKQWKSVILRLVAEAKLEAKDIAKKNLHALQLGFNRAQDSWQKKLYTALIDNYEIEQELQADLLNLLANANPQNVSFALKRLKAIQKKKQLDNATFIEAAPNLFYQESKTTVKTTIQMLTAIAKTDTENRDAICAIAIDGLMNEDGDIQMKIATLLLKYGAEDKNVLQEMLAPYASTLHTSAKELLKGYLTEEDLEEEEYIPDATLSKLDEGRAVLPVQDVDELLFLGHQVLEQSENPLELERFLGAFIQMKKEIAERPERLHPLLNRIRKKGNSWGETSSSGSLLLSFILQYFKEDANNYSRFEQNRKGELELDGFIPFVKYRVREILEMSNSAGDLPLLSTPTHEPFWINPIVLVERMLMYQNADTTIPRFDFILAMARVAFEEEQLALALEKSKKLTGEEGDVIRYLLSGKLEGKRSTHSLWFNAARTREPLGDFKNWATRWVLPSTPDLIKAPVYDSKIIVSKSNYSNDTYSNQEIVKSLKLSKKHYVRKEWLYVQLHSPVLAWNNQNFIHCYVPNNQEAIFAQGKTDVEIFLEPTLTMLPMAQIRLTDFMLTEKKVTRQVAHEAFIIQAELGKLDYEWIGGQIGKWIPPGYAKMNRLMEGLKFIASTSTLHAKAVSQVIKAIVPHLETQLPRMSKSLFELWYDLLAKTGESIDLGSLNPHAEQWAKKGAAKTILTKIGKLK